MEIASYGRSLFVTDQGLMGLAPRELDQETSLCIFQEDCIRLRCVSEKVNHMSLLGIAICTHLMSLNS
jgi:hypothetical protein